MGVAVLGSVAEEVAEDEFLAELEPLADPGVCEKCGADGPCVMVGPGTKRNLCSYCWVETPKPPGMQHGRFERR